MVMFMVKTTVLLRDDIYNIIVSEFGKRELSSTINKILVEKLMRRDGDGFGMFAENPVGFEREHHDRF